MDNGQEKTISPVRNLAHFSIGSAATNTHFSIDFDIDDPAAITKIDKLIELWMKTRIARNNLEMRFKG